MGGAAPSAALVELASEVGPSDVVEARGGASRNVTPGPGREVVAPSGVVVHEPADMTVRVLAGTTLGELEAALAAHGQRTVLAGPDPARSTVGGALADGRSGIRRLGDGPVRDAVLGLSWVGAEGEVVSAGGATVKNVSGFDLCRLMVGSKGTLGVLGEAVLRTRPMPQRSQWAVGECDPFALRAALHAPTSILWDGTRTWLLLEGHPDDVADQARVAAALGCGAEADGPPSLPGGGRRSVDPSTLRQLQSDRSEPFVAEVGVGVVHTAAAAPPVQPDPVVAERCRRIKALFDPDDRFSPGRRPW